MFRTILGALACLILLPGVAAAQNAGNGLYLEFRGGVNFLTDSDFDLDGIDDLELTYKTGFVLDGAFGYAHDSGLRGEVALGYRRNATDEFQVDTSAGSGDVDADGDFSAFSTMVNGYYDFHLDKFGAQGGLAKLTPFVGAGVGFAVLRLEIDDINSFDIDESESDTVFAYQGIAGLSYAFTPNVAGTLSYAYFATTDADFDGVDVDYNSHAVMAGLRYSF